MYLDVQFWENSRGQDGGSGSVPQIPEADFVLEGAVKEVWGTLGLK